VAEVREKGGKRFRASDERLIALYVLVAVVVGIASIVGATGDHLLRTFGGIFALNCLFSAYRVARPRPNGAVTSANISHGSAVVRVTFDRSSALAHIGSTVVTMSVRTADRRNALVAT
jgi:hypothetical protein